MGSEDPYDQKRLDQIVLLRAVMNVALDDLSRVPPHDVAVELAAIRPSSVGAERADPRDDPWLRGSADRRC